MEHTLRIEAPVAAGDETPADQPTHERDSETTADVVIAVASLADRVGAGAFPQRGHRRGSGVLGESLEQPSDVGAGEAVVAVATV